MSYTALAPRREPHRGPEEQTARGPVRDFQQFSRGTFIPRSNQQFRSLSARDGFTKPGRGSRGAGSCGGTAKPNPNSIPDGPFARLGSETSVTSACARTSAHISTTAFALQDPPSFPQLVCEIGIAGASVERPLPRPELPRVP